LTYGYDANGNRKNTGYTTGTGNQLTNDGTWTYTYDAEGNLQKKSKGSLLETWTYGYDNLNHLVWAEDRQTDGGSLITRMDFKYDVLGDRIDQEVTANSTTTATHFPYDGQNAWADLSGTNVLQTRRLYLDAVDALFARVSSAGTVGWYLTDRLNSVRDIADNITGASIDHLNYDGFGNATETQSSNGDRYKFTAREWDTVMRLQYNRGRYYDPVVGRWTSQDPIGLNARDSNLYRYVCNNPTAALDPTAKAAISIEAASLDRAEEHLKSVLSAETFEKIQENFGENLNVKGRTYYLRVTKKCNAIFYTFASAVQFAAKEAKDDDVLQYLEYKEYHDGKEVDDKHFVSREIFSLNKDGKSNTLDPHVFSDIYSVEDFKKLKVVIEFEVGTGLYDGKSIKKPFESHEPGDPDKFKFTDPKSTKKYTIEFTVNEDGSWTYKDTGAKVDKSGKAGEPVADKK
jgi:RHS repeat-associated protein